MRKAGTVRCRGGAAGLFATAVLTAGLAGCDADRAIDAGESHWTASFPPAGRRDVDLLFMIDNSSNMTPAQILLTQNMPEFMDVLKSLPGGLPNLHLAVVSSSMGAGIWGDVPGCLQVPEQNDGGVFRHVGLNPPGCPGPMGSFLITDAAGNNNYLGDVSAAFACIAVIGDLGCGFEHQFRSVEAALQRSSIPGDTNEGFLRDDAVLGVIMLTDEDDCSVPPDSTLLDPRQSGVSDPLGGLQTGYRCNEFGHLCDGRRPPHTVTGDTPLENCRSAEEVGRLVPVSAFVEKLKSFKADPTNQIFAAALAGPPTPYIVELRLGVMTTDGRVEPQPAIGYSCGPHINPMGSQSIAGAPSVRIRDWVEAFGDHGVFESICGPDFGGVLRRIAEALGRMLAATCIDRAFTRNADGTPSCGVTLRRLSPSGAMVEEAIPACDSALSSVPCWQIAPTASCAQELRVCWYPRCSAGPAPADVLTGQITCALPPP